LFPLKIIKSQSEFTGGLSESETGKNAAIDKDRVYQLFDGVLMRTSSDRKKLY